jgi:hypothetical protein
MDSAADIPRGMGCPIRRSPDRCLLAAPRGLSQRATSFIASWRQGIHQMPLLSSTPTSDNRGACPGPPAHRADEDETSVQRPCRETIPATTLRAAKGGPPENRRAPAYPCHRRRCPQTERHTKEGQAAPGLAGARSRAARPEGRTSRTPGRTGTSSPPHDVQTTGRGPTSRWRRRQRAGELVGLGRLERPTSRLSGVRSDQLSYRPEGHPPRTARTRARGPGPGVRRSWEGTCRRRRGARPQARREPRRGEPRRRPGARTGLGAGPP